MAAGYLPVGFGLNPFLGLALGIALLVALLFLLGRRPRVASPLQSAARSPRT